MSNDSIPAVRKWPRCLTSLISLILAFGIVSGFMWASFSYHMGEIGYTVLFTIIAIVSILLMLMLILAWYGKLKAIFSRKEQPQNEIVIENQYE